ncbi:Putative hemagglutinin protein [Rickettsia bellii OSU 85-389]|nr:Putative hemagglutinin protein [Rickettsia bellii OSU 85-389]
MQVGAGAVGSAIAAGVSGFASSVVVGTINNGGNVGKGLKSATSKEAMRSLGKDMLTAGVITGVMNGTGFGNVAEKAKLGGVAGRNQAIFERVLLRTTVNTAIKGGSLQDNFKSEALRGALVAGQGYIGDIGQRYGLSEGGAAKVVMHSALGGTYALASKGNVAIGMLAGGMGKALSGLTSPESSAHAFSGTGESGTGLSNWNDTIVAATAMLAGGSASDISTATTVSSSVVEYNDILHQEHRDIIAAANRSGSVEERMQLENVMLAIQGGEVGVLPHDLYYKEVNRRVKLGKEDRETQEHIKKVARELGKENSLGRTNYQKVRDKVSEYDGIYFRLEGAAKLGIGVSEIYGSVLAGGGLSAVGFPTIGLGVAGVGGASGYNLAVEGNNQLWGNTQHVPTQGARVLASTRIDQPTYYEEKAPELIINASIIAALSYGLNRYGVPLIDGTLKYGANPKLALRDITQKGKQLKQEALEIGFSLKNSTVNGWNKGTKYVGGKVEKVERFFNPGKAVVNKIEKLTDDITNIYNKRDTKLNHLQNEIADAQNILYPTLPPANTTTSATSLTKNVAEERVTKIGKVANTKLDMGPYGKVGGHHPYAKKAFEGHVNYDPKKGFAISEKFMHENKLRHEDMTTAQRRLFGELYKSGRPNTLQEHTRIAVEALKAGGATEQQAKDIVAKALQQLRKDKVLAPTNIPWYNKK